MLRIRPLASLAGLAVVGLLATGTPAGAEARWTAYSRPAQFDLVTETDVPITMRDGVVLRANVQRPDRPGRYPVLLVQTPYNKSVINSSFIGEAADFLARRGYAVVTVDVRGTGGSGGQWNSFGKAEQRDGYQLVEWAARQPWANGRVGGYGPSYMGITQLLTAAQRPPHLRAIFPIIPLADGYRDIVFSGGDINVSFIPLWMGIVDAGGFLPPGYLTSGSPADLIGALGVLLSHASGVGSFQLGSVLSAATGGSVAYDGPFWKMRSPLERVDRIRVPTFIVGGHHDLFQRGEPLLYERLKHHVPARLVMGPWLHITAGNGLPAAGLPATIDEIALRWFDRWLKGRKGATRIGRIPKVTQYVYGRERWATQADWPDPRLAPRRLFLRGGAALSARPPGFGEEPQGFLQQPLAGICTLSTAQWTAGLLDPLECSEDDRPNEAFGNAVYSTPPLRRALALSGPVLANLWLTTTARDAYVTVRITDVSPSGQSRELSTGWLAASFRVIDRSRSRFVRGRLIQPWHPFTRASVRPVVPGKAVRLAVEVFPVRAVINRGHRLRITVSPSDFPHQLPPLPRGTASLAGYDRILTDPRYRSYVDLPGLGACARPARQGGGCQPLRTPRLIRG